MKIPSLHTLTRWFTIGVAMVALAPALGRAQDTPPKPEVFVRSKLPGAAEKAAVPLLPEPARPPAARPKTRPARTTFTSAEIKRMQQHLIKVGYFMGRARSTWNGKARRALREWQRDQGFEATGVLTEAQLAYAND